MDLNRIITMVINQLIRRLTNTAISRGIDMAAGKGKPPEQMTPEERRLASQGREAAKLARKTRRLTRRF